MVRAVVACAPAASDAAESDNTAPLATFTVLPTAVAIRSDLDRGRMAAPKAARVGRSTLLPPSLAARGSHGPRATKGSRSSSEAMASAIALPMSFHLDGAEAHRDVAIHLGHAFFDAARGAVFHRESGDLLAPSMRSTGLPHSACDQTARSSEAGRRTSSAASCTLVRSGSMSGVSTTS